MKTKAATIEVFLNQGEVLFGDRNTRIRTVLGSCVAITLWHPALQIGGMCHAVLPGRINTGVAECDSLVQGLDGRYVDDALSLMINEIRRNGTKIEDYQLKLFGGGNMFPDYIRSHQRHVGGRNVDVVRALLRRHGMRVHAEHLGGVGHRNLIFDIHSGHVWMRHQIPLKAPCESCDACELREQCQHA